MANTDDMHTVTRKELREKFDEAITEWARRLTADLTRAMHEVTQVMAREIAHAVKSSEESTRSYMGAMLDKGIRQ